PLRRRVRRVSEPGADAEGGRGGSPPRTPAAGVARGRAARRSSCLLLAAPPLSPPVTMALFFKRVFPTELKVERLDVPRDEPYGGPQPAGAAEDSPSFGLGGTAEEDDYLQAGLTIYLPGEELDPLKLLQNPSPYTVRI